MSKSPRRTTAEQDRQIEQKLAVILDRSQTSGEQLERDILEFLGDYGQFKLRGYQGWNQFRDLCGRTLACQPPANKTQTRRLLRAVSRLGAWLSAQQTIDGTAVGLLSMTLSGDSTPVLWARRLLEAVPKAGIQISNDKVLCENMRAPNDPAQQKDWAWIINSLIQAQLFPDKDQIVYSFNSAEGSRSLLMVAFLWRASDKTWVGDEQTQRSLEWLARVREPMISKETELIDQFLAEQRRERLLRVAHQGVSEPSEPPVKTTRVRM